MNLGRGQVDDMDSTALDTAGLNTALSEATCLGVEVDAEGARLRIALEVLTVPPQGPPSAGQRVSLVLTGVGRVAASLRFHWWTLLEPEQTVLPLNIDGLNEAIQTFGGGALHGWEFVDPDDSSWKKWGELLSFDTTLGTDSASHVLEFTQEEGSNNRELDVRVWFTDIAVEHPDGKQVPLAEFVAGGVRWWELHDKSDPQTTNVWHVSPPL